MILEQGPAQVVRFESTEDITGKIWADVEGSTLTFGSKGIDPKKVNIHVFFTSLERLETSGAATVIGQSVITGDKFEMENSGASKVDLKLDVKNLYSEVTGAAETKLSGTAEYHRTEVSGPQTLKTWELNMQGYVKSARARPLNVTDDSKEKPQVSENKPETGAKVKNIEKSGISMS